MKFIKNPRLLGTCFLVTLAIAIIGGLLGIEGYQEWYPALVKPLDIPFWLFGVVQPVYYVICIVIMYRVLSYVESNKEKRLSLGLLVVMMFLAESWNYFFLGLRSVSLGFWVMLVFSLVALALYITLRKSEKVSSRIFIPYLVWLLVDISWIYGIWRANS